MRFASSRRPVMPKSIKTVRPSGRTIIAAVQVAVEHAEEHGALHERHEAGVEHGFGVDPGFFHRVDVVPRDAVEPFHHRHRAAVRAWGAGGARRGALVGLHEHHRDVEHVLRLEAEVELLHDRLHEQLASAGGLATAATGIRPMSRGASHDMARCPRVRGARPAGAAP